VLLDRQHLRLHLGVGIPSLILTATAIGWWVWESLTLGRLAGGGSPSGLACGVLAAAVIGFEMLLWPRKLLRRLRLIPAKYWMAAHLWLGVACLPLTLAHSGLHLGGWLPTTLMLLLVGTILSGVFGWLAQNVLPRWMLWNLPAETIYNQIDYVSELAVEDARALLLAGCGPRPIQPGSVHETWSAPQTAEAASETSKPIIIGAVRSAGRTRGRTLVAAKVSLTATDAPALWSALDEIRPFLLHGRGANTPVTDQRKAESWFNSLRAGCSIDNQAIIDTLQSFCDQRRQFDVQQTCHRWLHTWLPIHIALSVAVTVLLIVHTYTALKYW
jgi:hypothetical protein